MFSWKTTLHTDEVGSAGGGWFKLARDLLVASVAVHVFWVHLFPLVVPTQMRSTPPCAGEVPSSGAENMEVHCSPSGYPGIFAKHKPQQSNDAAMSCVSPRPLPMVSCSLICPANAPYNVSSVGRGRALSVWFTMAVWFTVESLSLSVGLNTCRVRE